MDLLIARFFGPGIQNEVIDRIQDANSNVAFDSTLRKELESLLEDAQRKRESQEKVENAG